MAMSLKEIYSFTAASCLPVIICYWRILPCAAVRSANSLKGRKALPRIIRVAVTCNCDATWGKARRLHIGIRYESHHLICGCPSDGCYLSRTRHGVVSPRPCHALGTGGTFVTSFIRLLRLMSKGVRFWEHGNHAVGPARQIAREHCVSTGTDLYGNVVQRHLVEEWTLRLNRHGPVWKRGALPSCWRMIIASQQARTVWKLGAPPSCWRIVAFSSWSCRCVKV
jgi:hypothetical protein